MYVSSLLRDHAVKKTSLYCPQGKDTPLCHLTPRPFKSDCPSRFVHGRRASILVLESVRNRRAECHLESRVIPADDSHTLPIFEEFLQSLQPQGGLRLNLAHRHPSIARLPLPTLPRHQRQCPSLACMVRQTRCPLRPTYPAQVQRWPSSFHLRRPRWCA